MALVRWTGSLWPAQGGRVKPSSPLLVDLPGNGTVFTPLRLTEALRNAPIWVV